MPVTDPIADLLTRMRNAQAARRTECSAPWSRLLQLLCELLVREGWLQGMEVRGDPPHQEIGVTFVPGKRLHAKRVSKPGRRWYTKIADCKPVQSGYGIAIISSSVGLLTDREARARKVGGEVLCAITEAP